MWSYPSFFTVTKVTKSKNKEWIKTEDWKTKTEQMALELAPAAAVESLEFAIIGAMGPDADVDESEIQDWAIERLSILNKHKGIKYGQPTGVEPFNDWVQRKVRDRKAEVEGMTVGSLFGESPRPSSRKHQNL